eukprot:964659-Alexandrium_andersonii.AAC.1
MGAANRALLDVQGGHGLHVLRNRREGRRGQLQHVDGDVAVEEEVMRPQGPAGEALNACQIKAVAARREWKTPTLAGAVPPPVSGVVTG